MIARHPLLAFGAVTFGVSLVAGLAAFHVGGSDTFDDPRALPLLLLMIWAPNLAALVVCASRGEVADLLRPLAAIGTPGAWLVALLPLAIAGCLALALPGDATLDARTWALLIGMNLVMGPLGEELGWRGFLLPRLVPELGTVGAALAVGVVWALWHLPLWFLPSPHSAIPLGVFFAVVVCFSVVMTAAWVAGNGALGPMIAFHLAANLAAGWLEAARVLDGAAFYRASLPVYLFAALVAAIWLAARTRDACNIGAAVA